MKTSIILLACALTTVGCQATSVKPQAAITPEATKSAEGLFAENQGLQQLTSEKLQTVLNGNTLRWADGSHVYYVGSEIRAQDSNGEPMVGAINYANDLHCRSWRGGKDKCSSVYQDGEGKLSFFVDGKPDSSGGYAYVLTGNPEGL